VLTCEKSIVEKRAFASSTDQSLRVFKDNAQATTMLAHPLTQALDGVDMVALMQWPDGRTSYNKIYKQNIIAGTDIASWLPRQIWMNAATRTQCAWMDRSQPSTTSAADATMCGVECPICLDELVEGDLVSRFMCSHSMHFECANQWLSSRIRQGQVGTCPMCNFVVVAPVFVSAQSTTQPHQQVRRTSLPVRRAFFQGLPRQLLSHLAGLCIGGTSQPSQRPERALTSDPDASVRTNIQLMV